MHNDKYLQKKIKTKNIPLVVHCPIIKNNSKRKEQIIKLIVHVN